jgi:hypothetical protein
VAPLDSVGALTAPSAAGAACGPPAPGFKTKFGLAAHADIDLVKGGSSAIAGAFVLATLCLLVPRLRDCASVNGIAQTASSESRINALRSRCALMDGLACLFIFCWRELESSNHPRPTRGSSWIWGDCAKRCLSEDPAPAAYSAVPKIR